MPEVQFLEPQETTSGKDDLARTWGERSSGRSPGRSAKKRQAAVQNLVRRLEMETRRAPDGRIEGPLRPCTIANFNPLGIVVEGQLRMTIPKPGSTTHHQMKIPYKGRLVQGHYCYIASPRVCERQPDQQPIYYTTVDGHEVDDVLGIDVPKASARVFTPHSIACEVWSQYNSPTHKLMGGLLVFDQGPQWLSLENQERHGHRIWVPERTQADDDGHYIYSLRETLLEDELDRIFQTQRDYCDVIIQKAHTLWAEQDVTSRKMVTDTDRDWARWAHGMGYLQQLPEWVNAKLILGDEIAELRVCAYCGTQQTSIQVLFCPKCNAPYDAFKAFMAGKHVPEGYLMTLEGEELEIVLRKLEERKAKFSRLSGVYSPGPSDEPRGAGPATKPPKQVKKNVPTPTEPPDDQQGTP